MIAIEKARKIHKRAIEEAESYCHYGANASICEEYDVRYFGAYLLTISLPSYTFGENIVRAEKSYRVDILFEGTVKINKLIHRVKKLLKHSFFERM